MIVTLTDGNTMNAGSTRDKELEARVGKLEKLATFAVIGAALALAFSITSLVIGILTRKKTLIG